jgi:hypothetical protein
MSENFYLDGDFDESELDIEELAKIGWDENYQEVSWEEYYGQF